MPSAKRINAIIPPVMKKEAANFFIMFPSSPLFSMMVCVYAVKQSKWQLQEVIGAVGFLCPYTFVMPSEHQNVKPSPAERRRALRLYLRDSIL